MPNLMPFDALPEKHVSKELIKPAARKLILPSQWVGEELLGVALGGEPKTDTPSLTIVTTISKPIDPNTVPSIFEESGSSIGNPDDYTPEAIEAAYESRHREQA